MPLHVRLQYPTGMGLEYSVERLADGLLYDFGSGAFSPAPAQPSAALPERPDLPGVYSATLSPTPVSDWPDGDYSVAVLAAGTAVALLSASMQAGDDATVSPAGGGGGSAVGPPSEPVFIGTADPGSGKVLSQAIGSYRRRRVRLRTPDGQAATGFSSADAVSAVLWAGDDQAPLATPLAEWDDPAQATVWVTFAEADTVTLPPGTYRLQVWVLSQGRRILGADAALRLTAVPGMATALPVYCSAGDVEALASGWVDTLQDLDTDQAGFAEERNLARRWLDRQVIARRRAWLDDWYRVRARWADDAKIEADLTALQSHLDADRLMRDGLDAGLIERITAHYALHLIFEPQIGEVNETSYQTLAERHRAQASRLLVGWTARVDTNGDGVADVILG